MKKNLDQETLLLLLNRATTNPNEVLEELRKYSSSSKELEISNQVDLIHGLALACVWKYDQAEKLLARACKFFLRANLDYRLAVALDELASIYLLKGDTNKAMMTWLDCLQYSIKTHNLLAQMMAHLGIGKTYYGLDNFAKAKQHHLAAIEISYLINDCPLICEAYTCLAIDYIKLIEFEKAYSAITIAKDYLGQAQHQLRSSCEIELYFAMSYAGQGQLSLAIGHFDNAIHEGEKSNYTWGLSFAHLEKAKCYVLLQQFENAQRHATEAEKLAKDINSLLFLTQSSEVLFQINKDSRNYEAALIHHMNLTDRSLQKLSGNHNKQLSPALNKYMQRAEEQIELENSLKENAELQARLAKHQELISLLTDKAERDSLTGIFNRRALDIRLEREIELANQLKQSFSVLMLDIDHFKRINDHHSHQVGDEVIKKVVQLVIYSCREGEFIARYGGEEFTVLLPAADQNVVIRVAERIRQTISDFSWKAMNPKLQSITISIGIASYEATESASDLMSRADSALYGAKNQGRNRVVSIASGVAT